MKKTEFYKVKAADKYLLEVKLDYPENPKSVVILCPGSGPNTYDNHRKAGDIEFNYFDVSCLIILQIMFLLTRKDMLHIILQTPLRIF